MWIWRKGSQDEGPWLDKHNIDIGRMAYSAVGAVPRGPDWKWRDGEPDKVRIEFDTYKKDRGSKFAIDLDKEEVQMLVDALSRFEQGDFRPSWRFEKDQEPPETIDDEDDESKIARLTAERDAVRIELEHAKILIEGRKDNGQVTNCG